MSQVIAELTIHCMAPGSLRPVCDFAQPRRTGERYEVTSRVQFDALLPGAPRCQDCLEWLHA